MKYYFQFFCYFALIFVVKFSVNCLTPNDITVNQNILQQNDNICFNITLPKDWNLAKEPDISLKSDHTKFVYKENFKQVSPNTYQVHCKLTPYRRDVLTFTFYVCNNICVVVNKDVEYVPNNSLWFIGWMVFLGFIGGLLLNIMPCVLPVILLKLKHISSKATIINSIIGNYISFGILATILTVLKLSGETVGWGMHFQNIYFLKFVVVFFLVLTLLSLDLIHFYWSINLDNLRNNTQNSISNNNINDNYTKKSINSNKSNHNNYVNNGNNTNNNDNNLCKFMRDILYSIITTMVAIPCTAPVLGTAATFAIQESIPGLFIIFTAIATGFSLPYIIALSSNFSMERFLKNRRFIKIINFGVVITLGWVVWLLFRRVSVIDSIIIGMLLLAGCVLLIKQYNKTAILLLGLIIFIPELSQDGVNNIQNYHDNQSIFYNANEKDLQNSAKFSEAEKLIQQNNIVILNITADWCLSCIYNKLQFQSDLVQAKIQENSVKFIEIDITKKNTQALEFISNHGRTGIPFTIIYGPKNKSGILLSEIPNISEIIKTIDLVK